MWQVLSILFISVDTAKHTFHSENYFQKNNLIGVLSPLIIAHLRGVWMCECAVYRTVTESACVQARPVVQGRHNVNAIRLRVGLRSFTCKSG